MTRPLALLGAILSLAACNSNLDIVDGQTLGPVTTVEDGFVSAFMLPLPGGQVALFDANNDDSAEALKAALQSAGRAPADVSDIFISHGHGDHLGGIPAFPGARIRAFQADAPLIADEGPEGVSITDPLEDGAFVELPGGVQVEVFAVPGHTPGSAVFLVGGVLLMGDTAVGKEDSTVAPPPRIFSEDADQAEAALGILAHRLEGRAADVTWMAFSHSGPLPGLDPLLQF